jgi:hypothetical protein
MIGAGTRVTTRRTLLLVLLSLQLLSAGVLRWHLTTATLKTEFDYLLAQEVIASENWRREGAIARHFVPSRSIDQSLPEWTYRDDYWRDYLSQPPLSFALHYGAIRLFPETDPVLAGKLLAQLQIAAGVLCAGVLLLDVFGFAATLAGLSFLIWGRPFLIWFVDGYYSTTPAMVFVLLLTAWCLAFFKRTLAAGASATAAPRDYVVAGLLAYGGVLSEWIALFGCAIASMTFAAMAAWFRLKRSPRAGRALAFCASIIVGSAAAVVTMAALYGTKVGFAFFVRQFMSRVDERTGAGAFGLMEYTGILIQRLHTSWPAAMLLVLTVITLGVLAIALAAVFAPRSRIATRANGPLLLLALILGFGGPLAYCYRLQDLVAIHWWFSGTWAVAWTIAICAFVYAGLSAIDGIRGRFTRRAMDIAFCATVVTVAVAWNLQFADLTAKEGAVAEGTVVTPAVNASHELYRAIGGALPRDGAPLVVADMPHLFNDYPFATAYLRRPVVRMDASGTLSKLGTTEDALPALLERGGSVYVAYDRSLRVCAHPDATPAAWRASASLAVCRVPVTALAIPHAGVFSASPGDQSAVFARWVAGYVVNDGCCDGSRLLDVTRLVDSRLRVRSGDAIDAARRSTPDPFLRLVAKWQERFAGAVQVVDPRFADVFVAGVAANADRWYLLLVNGGATALPDYHEGVSVIANGRTLGVLTPYQSRTTDGKARLPFSLIAARAPAALPRHNLTIDLVHRGAPLTRTTHVAVAQWDDDRAMRNAERDALTSLSTGCAGPPGPPADLQLQPVPAGHVRLTWNGAPGGPETYVLHGGSAPGAVDVTQSELGDTATTFEARQVPRGTYYLRVRGRNACGLGAASTEVVAVVP